MNNILTVVFDPESSTARASGLWQYDYGQVLRIQGLNLPKAVEIHFSLDQKSGESIARIGTTKDGVTDVPIPDSMLEYNTSQNYNIYAFIFISDTNSGNTEYRITIPVKARPKPEVPGSPEEPELFREAIEAVNQAADRSETARDQAEEAVTGFDQKVSESVTLALRKITEHTNNLDDLIQQAETQDAALKSTIEDAEDLNADIGKLLEDTRNATIEAGKAANTANTAAKAAQDQTAAAKKAIDTLIAQTDHITFQVGDDGGLDIIYTE
nr:hypothetical protein [uncultured Blautia sp.]